jgi:hypothetical protein
MPEPLRSRIKNAWSIFTSGDQESEVDISDIGKMTVSLGNPTASIRRTAGDERTIINAIYNRMAMDVASVDIRHVRVDENQRYLETINDSLNQCFTVEANIDQTGRQLIQDAVLTMFKEGAIAIVPTDTDANIYKADSFEVRSLRVGVPTEWYPQYVKVHIYDDRSGMHKDIMVPKTKVAIVQNPFYIVMNDSGSLMKRLIRKLNLLDVVDQQSSSGKMDLIIQLPYTIKSEARREQAEKRLKSIEDQLSGSKYGIAYADATEHITQLNRSVENNLLNQIEYLTNLAYGQLGITPEIMNGTADEKVMTNYNSRVIEPILAALTQAMARVFLSQTARTQGQDIRYFRDPFKLLPISEIAEIADKFTRNEITSSNEIRQAIGMVPSADPKADELRNANIAQSAEAEAEAGYLEEETAEDAEQYAEDDYGAET